MLIITNKTSRACQTAERPRATLGLSAEYFVLGVFIFARFCHADRPNLRFPNFDLDPIQGTRRGTIKHISCYQVEAALVARTLEPFTFLGEIYRTGKVGAFLIICVIRAVPGSNQYRRIALFRIMKIEGITGLQSFCPIDLYCGKRSRVLRFICILTCECRCSGQQGGRRKEEKVAKLTSRNLGLFIPVVGKLGLSICDGRANSL